jgi:hypothetical protein
MGNKEEGPPGATVGSDSLVCQALAVEAALNKRSAR